MTGFGDALGAGVYGGATLGVDHGDLPDVALGVVFEKLLECIGGGAALLQEGESLGAVRYFDEGLGGDCADAGLSPGHDGADGEVVRLDADAELSCFWVAGDDRIGVNGSAWARVVLRLAGL